jgi:hypothetical protein
VLRNIAGSIGGADLIARQAIAPHASRCFNW